MPRRAYSDLRPLSPTVGKRALIALAEREAAYAERDSYYSTYSHENILSPPSQNCFQFITNLLIETNKEAYHEMLYWVHTNSHTVEPNAFDDGCIPPYQFEAFFGSLQETPSVYWELVEKPEKVESGDLIIYTSLDYEPKSKKETLPKKTGTHVMMALDVFERAIDKTHLTIIDSTRRPHSKKLDSRSEGHDEASRGGIGTSRLILHHSPEEPGFQWASTQKTKRKKITLGRLKD